MWFIIFRGVGVYFGFAMLVKFKIGFAMLVSLKVHFHCNCRNYSVTLGVLSRYVYNKFILNHYYLFFF